MQESSYEKDGEKTYTGDLLTTQFDLVVNATSEPDNASGNAQGPDQDVEIPF